MKSALILYKMLNQLHCAQVPPRWYTVYFKWQSPLAVVVIMMAMMDSLFPWFLILHWLGFLAGPRRGVNLIIVIPWSDTMISNDTGRANIIPPITKFFPLLKKKKKKSTPSSRVYSTGPSVANVVLMFKWATICLLFILFLTDVSDLKFTFSWTAQAPTEAW